MTIKELISMLVKYEESKQVVIHVNDEEYFRIEKDCILPFNDHVAIEVGDIEILTIEDLL